MRSLCPEPERFPRQAYADNSLWLVLEELEQVRRSYRFDVIGFVVMPEHIHPLIGEPERANPSTAFEETLMDGLWQQQELFIANDRRLFA